MVVKREDGRDGDEAGVDANFKGHIPGEDGVDDEAEHAAARGHDGQGVFEDVLVGGGDLGVGGVAKRVVEVVSSGDEKVPRVHCTHASLKKRPKVIDTVIP